jgi:hypothetical protein
MDGAGTIFDRIEQRLSMLGVHADIENLQKASAEYDVKITNNPADLDSKMIGLELKVVMLARLLNAAIDAMETHGPMAAPAAAPQESAARAAAPAATPAATPMATPAAGPTKKVKRLRQNPATGVIEEIEDTVEDNVIVADNRSRFRGGDPKKEAKKSVFIQACDDEPVAASDKAKK